MQPQSWEIRVLTGILPSLLMPGERRRFGISEPLLSHTEDSRLCLKSAEMETEALFVLVYDLYEYIWFLGSNATLLISRGLQPNPPSSSTAPHSSLCASAAHYRALQGPNGAPSHLPAFP